ncbi:MAG: hypothetical protein AAB638_03990 [Patescibacteria group bacterium]
MNILSLKNIATSTISLAGLIFLPMTVLAAPIVSIQSTPTSNSAGTIHYQIVVTNTGDQVANEVYIRDTLDANETFVSSVLSPDISSTANSRMMLTWRVPSIDPGATYTISLNTVVSGNFPANTVIADNILVEGINFPTQTVATTVLVGPITLATPTPIVTPVPTPTPTPTPPTLPVTGVTPLVLTVVALAGLAVGTRASRSSLRKS